MTVGAQSRTWSIRAMTADDVAAALIMRGQTRENAVSATKLAQDYGITAETVAEALRGDHSGWVCEDQGAIVGFAIGDRASGEVVVVALLPGYEGQGIGRQLLGRVEDCLAAAGHRRLWLLANPDPGVRASGWLGAGTIPQ